VDFSLQTDKLSAAFQARRKMANLTERGETKAMPSLIRTFDCWIFEIDFKQRLWVMGLRGVVVL